jgi:hypothetical protein
MNTQPWTGNTPQSAVPRINISPNAPYYLMHHPAQWELVIENDKAEWLPTFSSLYEIAGVNGVQSTPAGPDSTMARVHYMDKGFTILPQELGYQTRYPTRMGGYYYTSIWDEPKQVGTKLFWSTDEAAYNQWRRDLLESGTIAPPEPEILELLVERHEKRIERNISMQHIPEIAKKLDDMREQLTAMQQATGVTPEPTTKKRKGTKSDA